MPNPVHRANQDLPTGRTGYGFNGTDSLPFRVVANSAGTLGDIAIAGLLEEFEFRPGRSSIDSGAASAGTRTGSGTTTSGTVASSTYWDSWKNQVSINTGLIDGVAASGIIWGQITIGVATGAGTGVAKLTAEIANTANTASPATLLALTGNITITATEIFRTYDLPYLMTSATANAVPLATRIGAQHSQGGSTVVFRIMEASGIFGKFAPGL